MCNDLLSELYQELELGLDGILYVNNRVIIKLRHKKTRHQAGLKYSNRREYIRLHFLRTKNSAGI